MPSPILSDQPLHWWLDHIGSVHPTEIELGLDRIRAVADALGLERPAPTVITVAGTNGKGSVVTSLERALLHLGKNVGCYTSPHIDTFNERIRINGDNQSDENLVTAFSHIEQARGEISLSYFEYATLAALWLFEQSGIEIALLEVGLGGRLDAVNVVDPDITVITSIALDHQDWLGNDRETIALEKAGILRKEVPLVCGDLDPPQSLLTKAGELHCPLYKVGSDCNLSQNADESWEWTVRSQSGETYSGTSDLHPNIKPENAACSMQVLALLNETNAGQQWYENIATTQVPGRQEQRIDRTSGSKVLLDVAHNPAAMTFLAQTIEAFKKQSPQSARVVVVLAVMADKDIQDMACSLASHTDIWYIAQVKVPRCMPAKEAAEQIQRDGSRLPVKVFGSAEEAYQEACAECTAEDLIVVTGSFYTVAAVRAMSSST